MRQPIVRQKQRSQLLDQHYQHQLSEPLPSPWCHKGWFLCFGFRYQEPNHQWQTSFISDSILICNARDNKRVCTPNYGFVGMVLSSPNGTSNNHDSWIQLYCMMNTAQICLCRIALQLLLPIYTSSPLLLNLSEHLWGTTEQPCIHKIHCNLLFCADS